MMRWVCSDHRCKQGKQRQRRDKAKTKVVNKDNNGKPIGFIETLKGRMNLLMWSSPGELHSAIAEAGISTLSVQTFPKGQ
jgi:hypothetical protein